jgi:hypothetical protein
MAGKVVLQGIWGTVLMKITGEREEILSLWDFSSQSFYLIISMQMLLHIFVKPSILAHYAVKHSN